jgi:hypothetical protein
LLELEVRLPESHVGEGQVGLSRAPARRRTYEAALSLEAIRRLDELPDEDGSGEAKESSMLLARLGIVSTPDVPLGFGQLPGKRGGRSRLRIVGQRPEQTLHADRRHPHALQPAQL